MTVGALIDEGDLPSKTPMRRADPASFGEAIGLGLEAVGIHQTMLGGSKLFRGEIEQRNERIRKVVNEPLGPNPFFGGVSDLLEEPFIPQLQRNLNRDEILRKQDERLEQLKKEHPELRDVPTTKQIVERVAKRANAATRDLQIAMQSDPGFDSTAAAIIGGIGAAVTDPVNLAATVGTAFIPGAGPLKGAGALRNAMRVISRESAVNFTVEAAQQPVIAEFQKTIGNDFGFDDAATNVAMATLGGAAFTGAAMGAGKFARSLRDKARTTRAKNLLAKAEFEGIMMNRNPFGDSFVTGKNKILSGTALDYPTTNNNRLLDVHARAYDTAYGRLLNGQVLSSRELPFSGEEFELSLVNTSKRLGKIFSPTQTQDIADAILQFSPDLAKRFRKIDEGLRSEAPFTTKRALFREREQIIRDLPDDLEPIQTVKNIHQKQQQKLQKETERISNEMTGAPGNSTIAGRDLMGAEFERPEPPQPRRYRTAPAADSEPLPANLQARGLDLSLGETGQDGLDIYKNLNQETRIRSEVDAFKQDLDADPEATFLIGQDESLTAKDIRALLDEVDEEIEAVTGCAT